AQLVPALTAGRLRDREEEARAAAVKRVPAWRETQGLGSPSLAAQSAENELGSREEGAGGIELPGHFLEHRPDALSLRAPGKQLVRASTVLGRMAVSQRENETQNLHQAQVARQVLRFVGEHHPVEALSKHGGLARTRHGRCHTRKG